MEYYRANKEKQKKRMAEWYKANKDIVAANIAAYVKAHPGFIASKQAKRRAQELKATPAWANLGAIRAMYEKAARISQETGISHHVDHIIPLQGRNVCGLHVESNLRIITAEENISKSNNFETIIQEAA